MLTTTPWTSVPPSLCLLSQQSWSRAFVICSSRGFHGTFDDGLRWIKETPDVCYLPHCVLLLAISCGWMMRPSWGGLPSTPWTKSQAVRARFPWSLKAARCRHRFWGSTNRMWLSHLHCSPWNMATLFSTTKVRRSRWTTMAKAWLLIQMIGIFLVNEILSLEDTRHRSFRERTTYS